MSVEKKTENKWLNLYRAFVKYLFAGGMGFVLDYGILVLMYEVAGVHYLLSSAVAFTAGLIFVYICSNRWVFTQRRMQHRQWLEFVIFAVIGLIGLGLTVLFMWIQVDCLGIYPLVAKLITTGLVLMWNFGARKIILY